MIKLLTILPCLVIMFQPLNAKVDPPNYNFSLETLENFYPEKSLDVIASKYGKGEVMSSEGELQSIRFQVSFDRYKFPVLVQVQNNKVHDFFAKLPSYFLHDLFFQSLVNKMGKQTTYKKTGEEAYYIWDLKDLKHSYSAACTITCFPIFYAVEKKEGPKSLLKKMGEALK